MSLGSKLQEMALRLDALAEDYEQCLANRPLMDQWEREAVLAKIHFARGQASGIRQACYFSIALASTEEPSNDK